MSDTTRGAFCALLKYWRGRRGWSQLDLGLQAGVSARHLSFLETGRSRPSREMVMLLAEVLDVPLAERNALLRAAGFDPAYAESSVAEALAGPIGHVITTMLEAHEPHPMIVMDRLYAVVATNSAALLLLDAMGVDLAEFGSLLELVFDPALGRRLVVNWDDVAASLLLRLQREALQNPDDPQRRELLDRLLASGDVPEDWRTPDLEVGDEPALSTVVRLSDGT